MRKNFNPALRLLSLDEEESILEEGEAVDKKKYEKTKEKNEEEE